MEVKTGYKQTEVGVIPDDWEVLPFDATFQKAAAKNYQFRQRSIRKLVRTPLSIRVRLR